MISISDLPPCYISPKVYAFTSNLPLFTETFFTFIFEHPDQPLYTFLPYIHTLNSQEQTKTISNSCLYYAYYVRQWLLLHPSQQLFFDMFNYKTRKQSLHLYQLQDAGTFLAYFAVFCGNHHLLRYTIETRMYSPYNDPNIHMIICIAIMYRNDICLSLLLPSTHPILSNSEMVKLFICTSLLSVDIKWISSIISPVVSPFSELYSDSLQLFRKVCLKYYPNVDRKKVDAEFTQTIFNTLNLYVNDRGCEMFDVFSSFFSAYDPSFCLVVDDYVQNNNELLLEKIITNYDISICLNLKGNPEKVKIFIDKHLHKCFHFFQYQIFVNGHVANLLDNCINTERDVNYEIQMILFSHFARHLTEACKCLCPKLTMDRYGKSSQIPKFLSSFQERNGDLSWYRDSFVCHKSINTLTATTFLTFCLQSLQLHWLRNQDIYEAIEECFIVFYRLNFHTLLKGIQRSKFDMIQSVLCNKEEKAKEILNEFVCSDVTTIITQFSGIDVSNKYNTNHQNKKRKHDTV